MNEIKENHLNLNYIVEEVNTDEFPELERLEQSEVTIGDLHGDFRILLFMLIKHGFLGVSREAYFRLVEIYETPGSRLTADLMNEFDRLLQDDVEVLDLPRPGIVRLARGVVANDKAANNAFTLKLLGKLSSCQSLSVEILFSNRDLGLLQGHENDDPDSEETMISLKELYVSNLKVASYTVNEDHIVLYGCAAIGINTIKLLAENLNVPYQDGLAIQLTETIDLINQAFQEGIQNGNLGELYPSDEAWAAIESGELSSLHFFPYDADAYITKEQDDFEMLVQRPSQRYGYNVYYAYGQGSEKEHVQIPHVFLLDDVLETDKKRLYKILACQSGALLKDSHLLTDSKIQQKLTEFFETEERFSNRSQEVYDFLVRHKKSIRNVANISEDYLNSIITAYSFLTYNPYSDLYEGSTYQIDELKVKPEDLTNEHIEKVALEIREKNRVPDFYSHPNDGAVKNRLAAQAFITLHIGTISGFLRKIESTNLSQKSKTLLAEKILLSYMDPVQRPSRGGMLFQELLSLWNIEAFKSMHEKSQSFLSDIELLIDLGEFMVDKEALAGIISLEHLSQAVEVNLQKSLSDKVGLGGEKLMQSISGYGYVFQLSVNDGGQLQSYIEDFRRKYREVIAYLSSEDLNGSNLQSEVSKLRLQVNSIVQRTLADYLGLFNQQGKDQFKRQLKEIQKSLYTLKTFLIEQGCSISMASSLRTMRAGVNKHLDFILDSLVKPVVREAIKIDLSHVDQNAQSLIDKLLNMLDVEVRHIELKGKGRYDTYYCITTDSAEYEVKTGDDLDALKEEARFDGRLNAGAPYGNYEVMTEDGLVAGFNIIPHHEGKPSNEVIVYLSVPEKLKFLEGILSDLQSLHSMGILHRDLKLDNIIYDEETGRVKIINFGRAIFMDEVADQKFLLNRKPGLLRALHLRFLQPQVAPEHYTLEYPVSYSADVYSLFNIIKQVYPALLVKLPFSQLTTENPEERPSVEQLIDAIKLEAASYLELVQEVDALETTPASIYKVIRELSGNEEQYIIILDEIIDTLSDNNFHSSEENHQESNQLLVQLKLIRSSYMEDRSYLLDDFRQNRLSSIENVMLIASALDSKEGSTLYRDALIALARQESKLYLLAAAHKALKARGQKGISRIPLDFSAGVGFYVYADDLKSQKITPKNRQEMGFLVPGNHFDDLEAEGEKEKLLFLANFCPRTFTSAVVENCNSLAQQDSWGMKSSSLNRFKKFIYLDEHLHPAIYVKLESEGLFDCYIEELEELITEKIFAREWLTDHQVSIFTMLLNQESKASSLRNFLDHEKNRIAHRLVELYPYLTFNYKLRLSATLKEKGVAAGIINSSASSKRFLKEELSKVDLLDAFEGLEQGIAPVFSYLYKGKHILDSLEEPLPTFVYAYIRQTSGKERVLLLDAICSELACCYAPVLHDYMLLSAILDEVVLGSANKSLYKKVINQMIVNGPSGTTLQITQAIHEMALYLPHEERQAYIENIIHHDDIKKRIQYPGKGIAFWKVLEATSGYTRLLSLAEWSKAEKEREAFGMLARKEETPEMEYLYELLTKGDIEEFEALLDELAGGELEVKSYLLLQMIEDDLRQSTKSGCLSTTMMGCAILGNLVENGAWENLMSKLGLEHITETLRDTLGIFLESRLDHSSIASSL